MWEHLFVPDIWCLQPCNNARQLCLPLQMLEKPWHSTTVTTKEISRQSLLKGAKLRRYSTAASTRWEIVWWIKQITGEIGNWENEKEKNWSLLTLMISVGDVLELLPIGVGLQTTRELGLWGHLIQSPGRDSANNDHSSREPSSCVLSPCLWNPEWRLAVFLVLFWMLKNAMKDTLLLKRNVPVQLMLTHDGILEIHWFFFDICSLVPILISMLFRLQNNGFATSVPNPEYRDK